MPNQVHLMAVTSAPIRISRAIGEAHRRHRRRINFGKTGEGFNASETGEKTKKIYKL
jgi:hypothetical protein